MSYTPDELDALEEMTMSDGWPILIRELERRVQAATRDLLSAPATDVARIAALQAEIRTLRSVTEHVINALKRREKE